MPFKKGYSGNIQGRPSGTANKTTQAHREFIQCVIDGQKEKIETELKKLEGKEFISAITGLMEFDLPKLQRTDLHTDLLEEIKPIQIIQLPDNGRDKVLPSNS